MDTETQDRARVATLARVGRREASACARTKKRHFATRWPPLPPPPPGPKTVATP